MKMKFRMLESIMALGVDIVALVLVSWLSLWLTQDARLTFFWNLDSFIYLLYAIPIMICSYLVCGIYTQIWAFARVSGLLRLVGANLIFVLLSLLVGYAFDGAFSGTFYIVLFFMMIAIGWTFRERKVIAERLKHYASGMLPSGRRKQKDKLKMLVVGAGEAASILLQEFQSERGEEAEIVGLVDDNPALVGMTMHGVSVLGTCADISDIVLAYGVAEILVAIPSANEIELTHILDMCKKSRARVRIMPHICDSVHFRLRDLRTPDICDIIGREEFHINRNAISKLVFGKSVLVTGGGGSIGSELCRQIMNNSPRKLVIYDIYENSLYDLYSDLLETYGEEAKKRIVLMVGSVCDRPRIDQLFLDHSPQLVFHAAAYKHVPLMEDSPEQAVRNNVFGTMTVANAAMEHKADKFLLISTDKAVNPTNVMGASKHAAELVVLNMQNKSQHTGFVAVRFGNVLGSNGSAVVQFKRQIERGGPVRITHPDIIRYFMTINEAVSLVLDAMTQAENGELFVLDMGQPVKIKDLAYRMIEMAGLRPEEDIKIEYTGLRPGEKLYEELLLEAEQTTKTKNKKIFIAHPRPVSAEVVSDMLKDLTYCMEYDGDIKSVLLKYIPGYRINGDAGAGSDVQQKVNIPNTVEITQMVKKKVAL